MNGASKEAFMRIAKNEPAAELIWDALSDIHNVVKNRPTECGKRFIKRREAYLVIALLIGLGIGAGVLQVSGLLPFIR